MIKLTIIVDISILGFNAHSMSPTRKQSAVHSPFALKTRCTFATSLRRFSQSGVNFFNYYSRTVSCLCVTGANLGQRKHNIFRACAVLVPSVKLVLV